MMDFPELLPPEARNCALNNGGELAAQRRDGVIDLLRTEIPFSLFDYQRQVVEHILLGSRAARNFSPNLVVMPTGSGKTSVGACIGLQSLGSESPNPLGYWIAPQKELLWQASDSVQRVWRAGYGPRVLRLQVVSRRAEVTENCEVPTIKFLTPQMLLRVPQVSTPLAFLVFDEAHHLGAEQFGRVWEGLSKCATGPILGFTATPEHSQVPNFEALQLLFRNRAIMPRALGSSPLCALRELGVLAELQFCGMEDAVPEYYRFRGQRLRSLVLNEERWNALVHHVVDSSGQVVVFCLDSSHGRAFVRHLRWLGCSAEFIDGSMTMSLRRAVLGRFLLGTTRVLINVKLLVEGVDCPAADNLVLTYPIGDLGKLSQVVGRALRGPRIGGSKTSVIHSPDLRASILDDLDGFYDHCQRKWKVEFAG